MGTRHLTLVWYKGKWHIAQYGQWDGYPSGQGITVFRFLTNAEPDKESGPDTEATPTKPNDSVAPPKDNITALKTALDSDILYTPTKEQCARFDAQVEEVVKEGRLLESRARDPSLTPEEAFKKHDESVNMLSKPMMAVVPSLSRDLGAKILDLVAHSKDKVPIALEPGFITDYLFCEWAYVVDLDEHVLEVYSGSTPESGGRFENDPDVEFQVEQPNMVVKYTFEELSGMDSNAFVEAVEAAKADGEDDEEEGSE